MDYLSLKAAVAETEKMIPGRRITDAWQSGPREVVLKVHRGPGLILSIDPARPGLYLTDPEELPGILSSTFTDLLQARIKGTTVASLRMPEPGDRLVTITFTAAWPAKKSTPLNIVIEVMGRHSNLMILEDGRILHPLKVVPKEKSAVRPVVPGEIYHPPPPHSGIPVEEITAEQLPTVELVENSDSLIEIIRGLSPYTALQAARMATSNAQETEINKALAITLKEIAASCTGETGFLHCSGRKVQLAPFEPLFLDPSDTVDRYSPFSTAAAAWRQADDSRSEEVHDGAAFIEKMLQERIARIKSSLEHLDAEEERCRNHHEIRVMAEALLIHVAKIKPGAESVLLPDPYDPALWLTIPIDPLKNPQDNANDLFNRARRLKRGFGEVSTRRGKLEKELVDIRLAREALDSQKDAEPARKLLNIASSDTMGKRKYTQPAYSGPGRRRVVDGFTILVGKSSTDNEKVTFKAAGPNDLWLHARGYSGSHVVILTEKKQVPDKVLYSAAGFAAAGSGARNDTAPEIMVTERKWVRKLKGGKPGQVTVERFRTIRPKIQNPASRSQKKT